MLHVQVARRTADGCGGVRSREGMDQPPASAPLPQWEPLGKLEYTSTPCPVCGAQEGELRCTKQIRDIEMHYYVCAGCRALYANPRATADSLRNLYASKDFFEGSEPGGDHLNYFSFLADEPFLRRTARSRIARIRRYCPAGRMLEVASAAGSLSDRSEGSGIRHQWCGVFPSLGLLCAGSLGRERAPRVDRRR